MSFFGFGLFVEQLRLPDDLTPIRPSSDCNLDFENQYCNSKFKVEQALNGTRCQTFRSFKSFNCHGKARQSKFPLLSHKICLSQWTNYAVGGFGVFAILRHIKKIKIRYTPIPLWVLLGHNITTVPTRRKNQRLNASDAASVAEIIVNTHLLLDIDRGQRIWSDKMLVVSITASRDQQHGYEGNHKNKHPFWHRSETSHQSKANYNYDVWLVSLASLAVRHGFEP
jgi:hypothetical protein